jgi:apolipoprotein N-acyltransferase
MARISSSRFRPGPRLALLQTDFRQELKNHPDFRVIMATLERLVIKAGEQTPRPDLIVWPETSYPVGMVRIDPELPESEFRTQAYRFDPEMTVSDWRDRHDRGMQELPAFAALFDRPMVVGTSSYHFRPGGMDRLNSAIVVRPSAIDAVGYHKQALVPFGEYIPFVETLPWLLKFTPYTDGYIPSLSFGNGPRTLNIDGTRYAPIICFEDTIPHIVLGFFADNRPDVLLNLTNDGWFRGTAEHQAHLAISVFRSVECRTPMARAVNTGISALIDGNGRIRKTMARETSGVLTVEVPLDGRSSLYIRFGDWLPLTCLAITIGLFPLAVVRLLRSPPLAQVNIVG